VSFTLLAVCDKRHDILIVSENMIGFGVFSCCVFVFNLVVLFFCQLAVIVTPWRPVLSSGCIFRKIQRQFVHLLQSDFECGWSVLCSSFATFGHSCVLVLFCCSVAL